MKKGAKILLLTDFSEVTEYAYLYARQIAAKIKGVVEVLHVLTTPVDWVKLRKESEQYYPETLQKIAIAKSKLSELVNRLEHEGIQAFPTLIYSFGSEDVFAHVNHANPDLVIMGSQGRGVNKNFILGSNAQKVLRQVKIATLIVKEPPTKSEIKKVAFLTTLEENQKSILEQIKDLGELMRFDLELVFVNTPYNFFETEDTDRMIKNFLQASKGSQIKLINAHNLERGILYYSEKEQPDLFVIAKSYKPGIVKLFSPSLTENMVRDYNFPILSISLD